MKSKTTKVRRYLAAILTVLMIFQQATTSVIYASSEAAVPTVTEAPAAQTEEAPEKQVEETPEEKIPTEGESEQTETSTQDSADKQQEQTEEAQPTEEPQTEEAVTPAPETEIVSNEAPAVEMEAAALSAGTEESNNVPSATKTDLPSAWVKSQSVQKETNGTWADIGKDEQLDQNSTYHLNVTYEIPNTEKPQTDITYQYSLPSVFKEITSSGDIFNSSNEKMGTYNVEGGMILLNISAASIAKLSNLNGYFSCEFKFDKTQITTEKTITVTFPVASKIETFHFQEDTNSYLSTEKKQLEVDYQNGKIKYQINVTANEAENDVVIKDTLGEGLSFDTNSFAIKKNGSNITLQPDCSADNKTASFNLGDMAANDTCVIEYWAFIDNYSRMYNNGKNEVTVTKTNSYTYQSRGKTERSGNSVTTTFNKKWAEKNGTYNAVSKKIDWTITINAGSPLNIKGAVIKDIPGINVSISDDADVTVTKDDGSTFKIKGSAIKSGYTFTDADYMGKYVLSYTTVLPDNVQSTIGNVNVKNDYEFNNGKGQSFTGSKEIGVETIPAVTKECTYFTNNNSGANTADWKVTVTIASSGEHVFDDELQDGMTLVDDSVKVTDKDGNEVSKEVNVNFNSDKKAFRITFPKKTVENGNPIQYVITYKSNYDHSKIPTTGTVSTTRYTYKNQCKLDNNHWVKADFTVQGGEIFNKQEADKNLPVYDEANKTIRYKIVVNWANLDYTGKEVVVKDVLPAGTTFDCIDKMFKVVQSNGRVSYPDVNDPSSVVTVDTSETGVVYFRFRDIGSTGYGFNYRLKISDEYYKKSQSVTFKNAASLIVNGTTEKEGSRSETVNFNVVKKDSQQYTDSGNHKTNYIKYTVTINPAAVQLLPDNLTSGGLTLTDIIPDNLTLVINKTFPMTLRNTKDQSDNPALDYSYDSSTRKLVVNVPDNKALELIFYAQLSGKPSENVNVNNTVNLSGSATYIETATDSKSYQVVQSSAGLNGDNNHIRLKKTKEDASTPLKGAKFDIVKVSIDDAGNVTTQMIGDDLEVDDDGGLTYPRKGTNDKALIADTLYYYQEVEAPQGYQVDSGKYYFWNPGNAKETLNNRIQDAVGKGKLDAAAKTANTNLYGEIIVTNKAAVGTLEVTKTVSGLTLTEGQKKALTFTVNGPNGYSSSRTYDQFVNGSWKLENLPLGKYTVTEAHADIKGYSRATTYNVNGTEATKAELSVAEGQPVSIAITNTYTRETGSLQLKKTFAGEKNGKDLSTDQKKAIHFTVTGPDNYSRTVTYNEFDQDGTYILDNLPTGTYQVVENGAEDLYEGYKLSITYSVTDGKTEVTSGVTAGVTVTNTYSRKTGTLEVTKTVSGLTLTEKQKKALTFTVNGPNGYSSSRTYDQFVNGSWKLENLPLGKYTVTEAHADIKGYSRATTYNVNGTEATKAELSVAEGQPVSIAITNTYTRETGSLQLKKTFAGEKNGKDLSTDQKKAIHFTVTGPDNYSRTVTYNEFDQDGTYILDNLPTGTYQVVENGAEDLYEGYKLSITYSVTDGKTEVTSGVTAGVTVTNTYSRKTGTLEVTKTVSGLTLTEKQKKALTFTVNGPNGYSNSRTYDQFVNESWKLENLPLGEYTVTETNADMEGYKLTTTYSVDGGKVNVTNKETATITITNDYTKTKDILVKISKVDSDTFEVLGGAHLQVIGPDNKVVAEWDSDKDAHMLTGLTPGVIYTLHETAAPKGYEVAKDTTFQLNEDGTFNTEGTTATIKDGILLVKDKKVIEEKIAISGTKTWSDGGNQDGSRPSSITVNLLANGTKVDSKEVTAKDNWKYSFTDLPKYENGTAINYTVTEDAVAGYSTTINGYDITNSYTPGRTSVTVTKAWVDNDNKGNKRPSEIKIQLYADGRESGSPVALNEANKWTYTWTGLDEKNGGTTIAYTVKEVGTVDGYEASVSGDARTGYTITNTLKSGTLEIVKSITGDVSDSALTAEQKAAMTFTVTGPDGYSETVHYSDFANGKYTFQNLPLGEYTVTETNADMEGYKLTTTYSVDGGKVTVTNKETATITITNDYVKTKDVSVKVSKVDADTYEVLGGAHLQVIDPDGKVVAEWDSDKEAYTLTDLKPGVVYTIHETAAPKGYKVAEDTTFQLNEDGTIDTANTTTAISEDTLLVKDEKKESKDVSVSVTKKLVTVDGTVIGAEDATYYVALYSDADCTQRVSDVLALNFKNASASTVTFTGLEKGQTYYVGECESDGTCYLANICADGTMYMVDFSDGNAVTVDNADGSTTVYFDNQFENIPDGYYKEAELNITKKLVGSDGKAKNSNEIFYAGIFADEGFTQLSTDVSANIVPLDLAGGSEATAQVNVALPESGSITLYVTEVDSNGKPVAGAASFKYDVTVDNAQVTLNDENLSANVVITNTENSTKVTPTPAPGTPNTPNTTGGFSGKSAVRTGDSTPIGGFIALFAAAAVIAGATVFFKRRRKDEK